MNAYTNQNGSNAPATVLAVILTLLAAGCEAAAIESRALFLHVFGVLFLLAAPLIPLAMLMARQ